MAGTSDERVVLYRCPTPTNALCPCGAVARRLRRHGIEYETERVPYNRRARPEIEELTRQRRVPVLVDGEEVIHDSKRILEYLEWRRAEQPAEGGDGEPEEGGDGERRRRWASLYNVKPWRRRPKR